MCSGIKHHLLGQCTCPQNHNILKGQLRDHSAQCFYLIDAKAQRMEVIYLRMHRKFSQRDALLSYSLAESHGELIIRP